MTVTSGDSQTSSLADLAKRVRCPLVGSRPTGCEAGLADVFYILNTNFKNVYIPTYTRPR
jgi:hypothetical protein